MENSITAKELILSTNDKLKELDTQLNKLKCLTSTEHDKNIKGIRYNIVNQLETKKPEIQCIVDFNDKTLLGKIKKLRIKSDIYLLGRRTGHLVRNNNGKCFIMNDYYNIIIPEENQELFGKIADEILNADFTNNFLFNRHLFTSDPSQLVRLFPNKIVIEKHGYIKNKPYHLSFTYYPKDGEATLTSSNKIDLTNDDITGILSSELGCLSDYQKEYIEVFSEESKKIFVPDFSVKGKEINFNVVDDKKGLYLVKK